MDCTPGQENIRTCHQPVLPDISIIAPKKKEKKDTPDKKSRHPIP